jgi:hypothetical protein
MRAKREAAMKAWMLLPFLSAALAAQIVEGVVVDAVTGKPLAGAYVRGVDNSVVTDADGRFSLPRGTAIALQASHAGYLYDADWGLHPGSNNANVRVALVPEAVISGKVTDEDGFPVDGATIQALRDPPPDGQLPQAAPAWTSDLGEYRLEGLPAGRYRLLVTSVGGLTNWDQRYVPQYYPGTLGPGDAIQVRTGEEHGGADIRLKKLGTRSVSGRIVVENFSPAKLPQASMFFSDYNPPFSRQATVRAEADGFNFMVRHIPPGSYTLTVSTAAHAPQAGDTMAGQHVDVGAEDITGLVIRPRVVQAMDVPGTVVFEGGAMRPVTIDFQSGATVSAHSGPDGSFVARLLLPGYYHIAARADAANAIPVYAISARMGGREVLGERNFYIDNPPTGPIRITMTGSGRVYGKILDAAGNPVPAARVVFRRTEGNIHAMALSDTAGNYALGAVALGEYRVYVVTGQGQARSLDDPDYLKAHAEDFPVARVVDENNATEVALRLPARK